MSNPPWPPGSIESTTRFRTNNPVGWWWLLGGLNAGLAILAVAVVLIGGLVGLVVLGVLWVIANAILIPICLVAVNRTHSIDFATGVITPSGRDPLAPSEFVRVIHRQTAGRWGVGHAVVLQYRTGEFSLPLDEFERTPSVAQRREAVLWVIVNRLPVPSTAIVPVSTGVVTAETAIGRDEAARLLLGPIDRSTPNAWMRPPE